LWPWAKQGDPEQRTARESRCGQSKTTSGHGLFYFAQRRKLSAFHFRGEGDLRDCELSISLTPSAAVFGAASGDAIMQYDELLTVEEAATRLKISKHTLNRWRVTGEGPPFVKYGPRLVRYLEAALTDWEKRRTRRSTSDIGADASR
jgi:predicted DNA-binding transcriptional regulator AlpA